MSHTNPSVMKKKKKSICWLMLLPHQTLFYMLFMERQKSKNRSVTDFKLKRPLSSALRPKYFCICFDHHNQIKIRLNNYFKALP